MCTKITPKSLKEHGFREYLAQNGICYINGDIIVAYDDTYWRSSTLINDNIFFLNAYYECIEQIEFYV